MTLCSSQAQQAGFGPRPSIQDTTCFVNKIRDTDRRTQKERARAAASSLFTQTAGAITNVFFHTAFFFLPPRFTPCFLLLLPPPLLHTPSVFVSLRSSFSLHVPHFFYNSPVSLRQINPQIYCQAGVVYNITLRWLKKKKSFKIANSFDTFCWLEF